VTKTTVKDLKKIYREEVTVKLQETFKYSNVHNIPKVEKIIINRGLGESITNSKSVQNSVEEFKLIFGQTPVITKAKKSIAGFKLRKGMPIGCKVTLRGDRMYLFLNKLFNVVLPKIRDFRGLPTKSFDREGNYTFGIKEQLIFPEIEYDKVDKVRGFNISIVTTAKTKDESLALLTELGLPFKEN
jgi:large subunit ribosomal protein L5